VLTGPGFKCEIRQSFANAFREWRRKQGIPLKQIAADLGFSVATIHKWERGERFPTGHNFELLATYTGQPPCQLLCVHARHCHPGGCRLRPARAV
jgi:transcriptional regulator with XRE-family HTH domain